MNELDIVNEPIEFKLGKHRLMVKRISTTRRRAMTQSVLLGKLVGEIITKADAAYPKEDDKDRREAFVTDQMAKLPSGKALADLTLSTVPIEAICRIIGEACVPQIDADTVDMIIDQASDTEYRAMLNHICGKKK